MKKITPAVFGFLLLGLLPAAYPQQYPAGLFSVAEMHFDATREAKGFDYYFQTREAQAVLSSVAAYFGINPAYVTLATGVTPGYSQQGEQTDYELPVPHGYSYCATRIAVVSLVPIDGDRASTMNAAITPRSLTISTWTPVRNFGEGRSWVEGDAQVIGIKPDKLDEFRSKGVCAPAAEAGTTVASCRGRTCGDHSHGKVAGLGNSTPRLREGF